MRKKLTIRKDDKLICNDNRRPYRKLTVVGFKGKNRSTILARNEESGRISKIRRERAVSKTNRTYILVKN